MTITYNDRIVVGTAEVQGSDIEINGKVLFTQLVDTSEIVYLGIDGVTAANGFPLTNPIELFVSNLNRLYFIASTADQEVAWILVEV